MDLWIILLVIIVLVIGGILFVQAIAPSITEFHKDSLAPIRNLTGNPDTVKTAAMFI